MQNMSCELTHTHTRTVDFTSHMDKDTRCAYMVVYDPGSERVAAQPPPHASL